MITSKTIYFLPLNYFLYRIIYQSISGLNPTALCRFECQQKKCGSGLGCVS